jgi:hypothetical protein
MNKWCHSPIQLETLGCGSKDALACLAQCISEEAHFPKL